MPFDKLMDQIKKFEVETYKKSSNLGKTHVSFTGMPEKHPYDADKIIIVVDPFSANISYYEFNMPDIDAVEELSSLVSAEGTSAKMFRVWVRKGSMGIRSIPFVVEDTSAKHRISVTG